MTIRKIPGMENLTARAPLGPAMAAPALDHFDPSLVMAAAADDGDYEIAIFGVIGEIDWFTGEGVTVDYIRQQLQRAGERPVCGLINSPGGYVSEGATIFNLFRMHPGKVTMKVIGVAGSIASIVAMAGDRIEIAKAAFYFLHNSEAYAEGNRFVMQEALDALTTFDDAMTAVYAARTGLRNAEVEKIMNGTNNGGTLMDSQTAVDKGFADAVMTDAVKQGPKAESKVLARHLLDKALARASMPRAERRRLLNEISGKPRAADDATQNAGDRAEVDAVMARLMAL